MVIVPEQNEKREKGCLPHGARLSRNTAALQANGNLSEPLPLLPGKPACHGYNPRPRADTPPVSGDSDYSAFLLKRDEFLNTTSSAPAPRGAPFNARYADCA